MNADEEKAFARAWELFRIEHPNHDVFAKQDFRAGWEARRLQSSIEDAFDVDLSAV